MSGDEYDFEFEYPAADRPKDVRELQDEILAKAGENCILRSRLSALTAEHHEEITKLLGARDSREAYMRSELEQMRKTIEALRAEKQFLNGELKAQAHRSQIADRHDQEFGDAANNKSPVIDKKRPSFAAFGDGFIVKRRSTIFNSPKNTASTNDAEKAPGHSIVNVLLDHRMPHSRQNSFQLLSAFNCPDEPTVTLATALIQQPEKIGERAMALLDENPDIESVPILLALIYEHLLISMDVQIIPDPLVVHLRDWITQYKPFPAIEDMAPHVRLPRRNTYLLTCILYALDILPLLGESNEVGPNFLSDALATGCTHIMRRALAISATAVPKQLCQELPTFAKPQKPTIDLLFSGLDDTELGIVVHATSLKPYSRHELELGIDAVNLEPFILPLIDNLHCELRLAALQFIYVQTPAETWSSKVLDVLMNELGGLPTDRRKKLLSYCISYLWIKSPPIEKVNELVSCCSLIVYGDDFDETMILRARDLLERYTVPAELDAIATALS